jgi:hydroxyacylglutathione hydrolase
MLYLSSFTFNPFQENTFIIHNDEKHCWIVDPGMYNSNELSYFFNHLDNEKLIPQGIINTHTHIDHILGVNALVDRYNIPFSFHEQDQPVLNSASGSAAMFGFDFKDIPKASAYIPHTEPLKLGDDELHVLFVPGHSPGSIAFYYPEGKWLVSGDTLFSGSIGRTDLPGGNHNQLLGSIRTQLFTLPDDVTAHPGHGPATTIGSEKMYNPFLN